MLRRDLHIASAVRVRIVQREALDDGLQHWHLSGSAHAVVDVTRGQRHARRQTTKRIDHAVVLCLFGRRVSVQRFVDLFVRAMNQCIEDILDSVGFIHWIQVVAKRCTDRGVLLNAEKLPVGIGPARDDALRTERHKQMQDGVRMI